MNWDEFLRRFRLDEILIPNLRKTFKAAAWYKIPGLLILLVLWMPLIVLLTVVGRLKKPGGR